MQSITIHAAPVARAYTFKIHYRTYTNQRQDLTVLATSSVDAFSKAWEKINDFEDVAMIAIDRSELVA